MITTRGASGGIPSSVRRHSSLAGTVPGAGHAAVFGASRVAAGASYVRSATSARTQSARYRRQIMRGSEETCARAYGGPSPAVKDFGPRTRDAARDATPGQVTLKPRWK